MSKGYWCPYCSSPPQKLCDNLDCSTCFKKSFASHEKPLFWNYEKNDCVPRDLFLNCNTKYWFKCNTCDHSFDSELANINFGKWCPYCSNPPKQLCNDSNCITCFNKSFACHKKAFFWDSAKNKCSARDCFLNSECKYWFVCEFCQHSFEASLTRVSYNGWCPYCSNPPKKLCNNSTCTLCFKKSFAMSIKAKFWNDLKNKSITPRQVFCTAIVNIGSFVKKDMIFL